MFTNIDSLPLGSLLKPKQSPSKLGKRRKKKLKTKKLRDRGYQSNK